MLLFMTDTCWHLYADIQTIYTYILFCAVRAMKMIYLKTSKYTQFEQWRSMPFIGYLNNPEKKTPDISLFAHAYCRTICDLKSRVRDSSVQPYKFLYILPYGFAKCLDTLY